MKNEKPKKEKPSKEKTQASQVEKPIETKVEEKKVAERSDSGGSFWAIVLISFGLVFLLNNFGLLPWGVWSNIWKFWPIFLIFWGLQLVFGRNWFSNAVLAVIGVIMVLSVIAVSIASVNQPFRDWSEERVPFWKNIQRAIEESNRQVTTEISVKAEKYQNVVERRLNVDIGSASFDLTDDSSTDFLRIFAKHPENSGEPRLREVFGGGILTLNFDTVSEHPMNFFTMVSREYDLFLGQSSLPTSVSLDLGSGSGKFNFDKLNLRELKIDQGSGQLEIDLSEAVPSGEFSINLGSGNVSVDLPSGVGLKVKYQIGSGNLKVGSDSIRNGEGTFTSQNYETSTKKVEINIELGSGNININY